MTCLRSTHRNDIQIETLAFYPEVSLTFSYHTILKENVYSFWLQLIPKGSLFGTQIYVYDITWYKTTEIAVRLGYPDKKQVQQIHGTL